MRVLITGITGFVGSHLAEYYIEKGHEVFGLVRHRSSKDMLSNIVDSIKFVEADLTDTHSVNHAIEQTQPDVIHHLAAQSYVPSSWIRPYETMQVNLIGTLNLLEAIRSFSKHTVIQLASSSEVYGNQDTLPITEESLTFPASPYAVSKLAMEYLGFQYYLSYGVKTVITRAFNHFGSRRGEQFVESKIAKAVCLSKYGKYTLKLGNIDNKRDWTDVRDIVRGYAISVEKCEFGKPYNICSGTPRTIRSVIEDMQSFYKYETNLDIKFDESILRPSDVKILHGNADLFKKTTGWNQEYSWEQSCNEILDYWDAKTAIHS